VAVAPSGIVTLLTDFGLRDPFVGVMKGVMLGHCPALSFIDLTHDIAPQDVAAAAFWLGHAYRYFPEGTVHLAVVDPGVGSSRRALAALCDGHYFVAPDNGVLGAVLGADASVVQLEVPQTASRTFHGRDVFAPAAAALASGQPPSALGATVTDWLSIASAAPVVGEHTSVGQVMVVDHFGNLISNVRLDATRDVAHVICKGMQLPWVRSYADAQPGEIVALLDSWGLVEIAARNSNAAAKLGAGPGEAIELHYRA